MAAHRAERESLSIELERELMGKVRSAAEERAVSVPDFVVHVLRAAVTNVADEPASSEWARLSARAFARDWNSEDDAAYDAVAQG